MSKLDPLKGLGMGSPPYDHPICADTIELLFRLAIGFDFMVWKSDGLIGLTAFADSDGYFVSHDLYARLEVMNGNQVDRMHLLMNVLDEALGRSKKAGS